MQLILVRHAMPERVDAVDVPRGPADPALTERGRRQAARLVDALRGVEVAALYASPMARARDTAAPLAEALGCEPRVLADLREYDAEAARYVPVHDMARADPTTWERMVDGLLPTYVDADAFRTRVVAVVERVVDMHPGRVSAVLVAHAGVINAYLAHVLGIERPLPFVADYAGISRVIARRDGRRTVRSVNETAHVADLLQLTCSGSRSVSVPPDRMTGGAAFEGSRRQHP